MLLGDMICPWHSVPLARCRDTHVNTDFTIGEALLHFDPLRCNHQDNNICPVCAEMTPAEVQKLGRYFEALVEARRQRDRRIKDDIRSVRVEFDAGGESL